MGVAVDSTCAEEYDGEVGTKCGGVGDTESGGRGEGVAKGGLHDCTSDCETGSGYDASDDTGETNVPDDDAVGAFGF